MPRAFALALILAAPLAFAPPAFAQVCAVPGLSGVGAVAGIVNTYYPGSASVSAGSLSIPVGTKDSRGSSADIAAGDLLLVIQVQDASISSANNSSYGGSGSGQGYTGLNASGLYEYAVATGPVSAGSRADLLRAPQQLLRGERQFDQRPEALPGVARAAVLRGHAHRTP